MKTKILLAVLSFCLPLGQSLFAENVNDVRDLDSNGNGRYESNEVSSCSEYQTGPCVAYCPVTRFKPKYYCEKRCVQEPYTVQKKCCRYVPQYYTRQYCRYVPQYYTKTFCKEVPEYYCVNETRYRTKYVTEQKCCYLPYTCVERRTYDCMPNNQATCSAPSDYDDSSYSERPQETPASNNYCAQYGNNQMKQQSYRPSRY